MALRVIGPGVGRTGTYSLQLALERLLDGRCHHMAEVLADRPRQLALSYRAADPCRMRNVDLPASLSPKNPTISPNGLQRCVPQGLDVTELLTHMLGGNGNTGQRQRSR